MINKIYFGKYRVIKLIGKGGMSEVYLAENIKLGNQWAIKRISKHNDTLNLLAEPNILKNLNHMAIPQIIDVEEDEDFFYIIEEYVEGITLKDYKRSNNHINEKWIIQLAIQLCDILEYLHTRKYPIIYRDMKPDNIMLMNNDKIKLIDFGIAREYKYNACTDTVQIGTRGYAAPEQYGMTQSDERTDIYSFGVTLYFLITGKNLGDSPYKILPPKQTNPNISDELNNIIVKCTEIMPSKRFRSVTEVKERLYKLSTPKLGTFRTVYTGLKHKTIGVLSLTKRAGSTFLSTNLARAVADLNLLVSLIELPYEKPYIYDLVGIFNHMEREDSQFYSIVNEVANYKKVVKKSSNVIDNITYLVPDPTKNPITKWDDIQSQQLMGIGKNAIISIVDIGQNIEKIEGLLFEFDMILVLFDAFPPDLMNHYETLERLRKMEEEGHKIHYVLNYDNKGINKKVLYSYMNIKPLTSIPSIPRELIYEATYKKKIPYSIKELKVLLEPSFNTILKELLPSELIKNKTKKKKRLFR